MATLKERGGMWVAAQMVLLLAAGVVIVSTQHTADQLPNTTTSLAGFALIGFGAYLGVNANRALGKNLTPLPEPVDGARLITTGIYARVRHPIYGAVVLIVLGAAIWMRSAPGWLAGTVLLVFFIAKSNHEEKRLLERFPAYEEYRNEVKRRLIPGVL